MAARRNALIADEHRQKIKTSQLINRLQDCALGAIELSPSQVRSVEILLRKSIPDLQAIEIGGDTEDGSIPVRVITGVPRTSD